jgi:ABC-2 type transport system ATP-binding protein
VFVSSHLLAEVQNICDSVAILARGRVVAAGSVEEVLNGGHDASYIIRIGDQARSLAALHAAGFEAADAGEVLRVRAAGGDASSITRTLAERGLYISELRPEQSLETVFLELTEERAS